MTYKLHTKKQGPQRWTKPLTRHRENLTASHGRPISEVGYTTAMHRMEDHKVHKGHVLALDQKIGMNREGVWQWVALPMSWYIDLKIPPGA